MARRNIMRKFRIGEISGVDHPCQVHARAVIFKRAAAASEPRLEGIEAAGDGDWTQKRETALQALQKRAEKLAAAESLSAPAAWDAVLSSPEGAALYAQAS